MKTILLNGETTMKTLVCFAAAVFCLSSPSLFAQDIEATLSGNTGFTVKDNEGNVRFTIRGDGTTAMGYEVSSSGWASTAMGNRTNASGGSATAMGDRTTASGGESTAMGSSTTASATYSTAMGDRTTAGGTAATAMGRITTASGNVSTAMGDRTTASGDRSTAMGTNVTTNDKEGAFVIGDYSVTSITFLPDVANRFYARFSNGYTLYTNSDATLGVRLDANGGSWSSISDSTKKENFVLSDAEQVLARFRTLRLGSWSYIGDSWRHYGPMAQEWFAAFGSDGVGVIGNDTLLASADVDGVLCIAVKALEQRTHDLLKSRQQVQSLEERTEELANIISRQQTMIERLESTVNGLAASMKQNRQASHATEQSVHEEPRPDNMLTETRGVQ
jgi:trimeric autotransporter adhesin/endosialidase-like protein